MATEALADRLHSAAIHLLRLVRVQDATAGIGPAQLSALSVMVFGGPLSLNQLARAEQVKPPTMSRVLDALEKAGLARRRENPTDRRAVLLEATDKGTSLLRRGRDRRVKFLARYLTRLSAAELRNLNSGVSALEKALR